MRGGGCPCSLPSGARVHFLRPIASSSSQEKRLHAKHRCVQSERLLPFAGDPGGLAWIPSPPTFRLLKSPSPPRSHPHCNVFA